MAGGRERRTRRRAAGERSADAPLAAARRRALWRAVIIAAILGLAAGWLVRTWFDRSPGPAPNEASETIRGRARGQTR